MVVVHFFFAEIASFPFSLCSLLLEHVSKKSCEEEQRRRRLSDGGWGGRDAEHFYYLSYPSPLFFSQVRNFESKRIWVGDQMRRREGRYYKGKVSSCFYFPTLHTGTFFAVKWRTWKGNKKKLGESSIVLLLVFGQGGEKNRRHLPSSHILLPLLKLSGEAKIPTLHSFPPPFISVQAWLSGLFCLLYSTRTTVQLFLFLMHTAK